MSETAYGLLLPYNYGRGNPEYVSVATPAAASNASFTVDGKFAIRVIAARLSITTDANAANREVTLDFIDARGVTRARNGGGTVVTANTTAALFDWNYQLGTATSVTNGSRFLPLAPLFLYPGFVVTFAVSNKQAADQISGLSLWIEQFPTGPRGYVLGVGPGLLP